MQRGCLEPFRDSKARWVARPCLEEAIALIEQVPVHLVEAAELS
jgi:hypothetical protein